MKEKIKHIIKDNWELILFSGLMLGLIIISSGNIFFWDTVQLGARHASFYYDNELSFLFLPNEIDSGHIPTFGYALAVCWKIFGKTLLVSHLFILPFAIGIVWQLKQLVSYFFSRKYLFLTLLIVLMDTTFLSQVTLVSPDIPLLFFFLYGLNGIIHSNRLAISIAFSCLFLISMRGMILTVPLFIFDVYINGGLDKKHIKESLLKVIRIGLPYIPAAIIFIGFNWFHFSQKGWIGYHKDSPWAVFFQRVGFSEGIRNLAIFGWRLLDFGRVFVWLTLIMVFLFRKKIQFGTHAKNLLILSLLILLFLSIPAIVYFDLKGHRYFMPIYFSISLLTCYIVLEGVRNKNIKNSLVIVMIVGLFSGNFWVYPKTVSQGWDSTLAHLPYYKLRENMIQFIEDRNIPKEDIGYDFPGGYEQRFLDLSDETWYFPEVRMDKQNYILYANVVNEFTNEELAELEKNWESIHQESSLTVTMILYKRIK